MWERGEGERSKEYAVSSKECGESTSKQRGYLLEVRMLTTLCRYFSEEEVRAHGSDLSCSRLCSVLGKGTANIFT